MKTKLFSFLLALAASVGTIFADGTKIGDLYYNLDAENRTAEVTTGNYSGLTSADIPSSVTYNSQTYSVTSIGDFAFAVCSSLTFVTIPNSVTSIGIYAFYKCSSLTSLTIPNSVTSIGGYAFAGCSSLTSIIVEAGNTAYDSRDNCNAIIETSTNTLIAGCQNTTIPNSVTSIGEGAFGDCESLTSITIPNSVTSIGQYAFGYCSSLTSVYNYAATPQAIASGVFYGVNVNTCTLYVPEESIALYQSANVWKDFGSIKAAPELSAVEQIRQNTKTQKTITNGQLLIIKNGKTYSTTGAVVK